MSQRRRSFNQHALLIFITRRKPFLCHVLISFKRFTNHCSQESNHHFYNWMKPATSSLITGTLIELAGRKSDLKAEKALLAQQLILPRGHVKRPAYTRADRMFLGLLARMVRTWKQALFVVLLGCTNNGCCHTCHHFLTLYRAQILCQKQPGSALRCLLGASRFTPS